MDRPFDLGGVLVRIVRSWGEAHVRAGIPGEPLTDPEFEARRREISRGAHLGVLGVEEANRAIAAAAGGHYSPEDIQAIMGVWLIGEYPRVRRVLDELEMVGIETALLSNTNAQHWDEQLNDLESRSRFPAAARPRHRYASHELGLMKPDPAIFAALELSTRHEPARILFFDDLDENIEGARAAGWTGELIDHRGDTAAQMLDALRRHEVIG